ncbi:DUF7576 family protein [Halosolutus gelatinilyticus]|uniref:DUF7576 family protein n=1 Tax=Halosolutus gelatinilyticus TaxID=2931975 RepID=UPI001FF0F229|nr:hypothetical protein [Halosolutus gelatinilyticus]
MGDSEDENGPECRTCGEPIDAADDRRVVTVVEGGEAIYRQFCGEDCLSDWES